MARIPMVTSFDCGSTTTCDPDEPGLKAVLSTGAGRTAARSFTSVHASLKRFWTGLTRIHEAIWMTSSSIRGSISTVLFIVIM